MGMWGLLKHHWGKALIVALIGAGLTAAGLPPAAVGILAKAGGDAVQGYAEEKDKEAETNNDNHGNDSGGRRDSERSGFLYPSVHEAGQQEATNASAPHGAAFVASGIRPGHTRRLGAIGQAKARAGCGSCLPLEFVELLERDPDRAKLQGRPGLAGLDIFQNAAAQSEVPPFIARQDAENPHSQHIIGGFVDPGAVSPALRGADTSPGDTSGPARRDFAFMAGNGAHHGNRFKPFSHNSIPLYRKSV